MGTVSIIESATYKNIRDYSSLNLWIPILKYIATAIHHLLFLTCHNLLLSCNWVAEPLPLQFGHVNNFHRRFIGRWWHLQIVQLLQWQGAFTQSCLNLQPRENPRKQSLMYLPLFIKDSDHVGSDINLLQEVAMTFRHWNMHITFQQHML